MRARFIGAGIVLLGAVYLALSLQLPLHTLSGPGAGFFPVVVAVLLMGSGLVAALPGAPLLAADRVTRPAAIKVSLVVLSLFAFCLLLPRLGYLISAALLIIAVLRQFETSWLMSVAAGAVLAGLTYVLFVHVLGLALPLGSWLP